MHAHAIYTRLIALLPLCEKSGGLVLEPHAVVDCIIHAHYYVFTDSASSSLNGGSTSFHC